MTNSRFPPGSATLPEREPPDVEQALDVLGRHFLPGEGAERTPRPSTLSPRPATGGAPEPEAIVAFAQCLLEHVASDPRTPASVRAAAEVVLTGASIPAVRAPPAVAGSRRPLASSFDPLEGDWEATVVDLGREATLSGPLGGPSLEWAETAAADGGGHGLGGHALARRPSPARRPPEPAATRILPATGPRIARARETALAPAERGRLARAPREAGRPRTRRTVLGTIAGSLGWAMELLRLGLAVARGRSPRERMPAAQIVGGMSGGLAGAAIAVALWILLFPGTVPIIAGLIGALLGAELGVWLGDVREDTWPAPAPRAPGRATGRKLRPPLSR